MRHDELFSIGEFSKITGLTVKSLRFYHEQNLLAPTAVDDQTGYRYYDAEKIGPARVIAQLRELEFSLSEIAEILRNCQDESDMVDYFERHKKSLAAKQEHYHKIERRLDEMIRQQQETRAAMKNQVFEIEEKTVDSMRISGVRMKGHIAIAVAAFRKLVQAGAVYRGSVFPVAL